MKKVRVLFGSTERAIRFLVKADQFDAPIDLQKENFCVNAKSILCVINSDMTTPIDLVIHEENETVVREIERELSDFIVR